MIAEIIPLAILTLVLFGYPLEKKLVRQYRHRNDLIPKARRTAIRWHAQVNHRYGNRPYSYHLKQVVEVAMRFKHTIPPELFDYVIAACWLHDAIEDTRHTYNDVKVIFGKRVAEIVYAVTNEKGRTRSARANIKYYNGIMHTEGAAYVKLFDRVANVENSKKRRRQMYDLYCKENIAFIDHFCMELRSGEFENLVPIVRHLNWLCTK